MTTPRSSPAPTPEFPAGEPRPDASDAAADTREGATAARPTEARSVTPKVTCEKCSAPYGEDGWVDCVIPNEVWNTLGFHLLCFRCMTKELQARREFNVPILVASGPYHHDPEYWRLEGVDLGIKIAQDRGIEGSELAALRSALEEALEALEDNQHSSPDQDGEVYCRECLAWSRSEKKHEPGCSLAELIERLRKVVQR